MIRTVVHLVKNRLKGHIFKNMILAEYQKKTTTYIFTRIIISEDSNGHEVNLLMKKNKCFTVFEVKATQTISENLFKEMNRFEEFTAPEGITQTAISTVQLSYHVQFRFFTITGF